MALEAAYRHGGPWLDALMRYLAENLAYVQQRLEKIPSIQAIRPEGTYLVWLDCRELGLSQKQLDDFFLRNAGLALNAGHTFGPGGEGFQRINIACPRSLLVRAMDQLEAAVAVLLHSQQ